MRGVGSVELLDMTVESAGKVRRTGIDRLGASWLLDGDRVLVAGGLRPDGELSGVRTIEVEGGAPPRTWGLGIPRYLHGDVAWGAGQWLLVGGLVRAGEGLSATASVVLVDAWAGRTERVPDLPFATVEPLVLGLRGGRVLVAGGYDDDVHGKAAVLDTDCYRWRAAPPLPRPRAGCHPPIALDGRHVLFAGGWTALEGVPARDGVIVDTHTLEWQRADIQLPAEAAVIGTREGVLVSGGRDERGEVVAGNVLWMVSR